MLCRAQPHQTNSSTILGIGTEPMTEETAEQFIARARTIFKHESEVELRAIIHTIWMIGACERLGNLGILSGGQFISIAGSEDEWDNIDRLRHELIPPTMLGMALAPFVKEAATEELRDKLAEVIALYYLDSGRQKMAALSLERLFQKPSQENSQ